MTSHDHNKTLGLVHGLIGMLVFTVLIILLIQNIQKSSSTRWGQPPDSGPPPIAQQGGKSTAKVIKELGYSLYLLPLPLTQLLTAYGILKKKRWGRILALALSVLYVWVFPLGTLLAIYTWWFLHSEGSKRLYIDTAV